MSDLTLHHVHLVTNDIQGFCDFYGQNFGAEIVFDDLIDGDRNIFLKIGTGRIHLFESRSAAPDGRNVGVRAGVATARGPRPSITNHITKVTGRTR